MGTRGRADKEERLARIQKFAKIIANGGRRQECFSYGEYHWGVKQRMMDYYLAEARKLLQEDWKIERRQMVADLLSQCATVQIEARRQGNMNAALGAINTMAKIARVLED